MTKIISIITIILIAGGAYFFMNSDSQTQTQKEYTVVAFGDSLTAGYGVDIIDSYPTVLQSRLREINPNVTIINMGISGETTAGGLKRIDSVIEKKPDMVLLGLGANDLLRSLPVVHTKANLSAMIEKFQAHNIQVILLGMRTSLNSPSQYRKEFNDMYPELAEKYNVVLVPYFLEGVFLNAELNISDRLHPNKAGYVKIVDENIMPVVKGMFR